MAVDNIDRFLKGVEGLASLDPDDLAERLSAMRQEGEMLQLKIGVLERLHAEAVRRAKTTPQAHDDEDADGASSTQNGRPYTWKTDAIREFLASEPQRMFSPREVRDALRRQGIMRRDEGTATSVVLQRLARRKQATERDGRYGYRPSDPIPSLLREEPQE